MHLLAQRLRSLEAKIDRWPWVLTIVCITILAVIKQGLTYVQMFEDRFFTETPEVLQFPDVVFTRSLLITRLFNLETRFSYQVFSLITTIAVLAITAWLLHRRLPTKAALIAFAGVALGQVGLMSLGQFGREDTWFILGAVVLMLSGPRSWPLWVIGAVLMGLANPGQAVVATSLMTLLAFTPHFRSFIPRTPIALGVTGLWMLIVYFQQSDNQVSALDTYWLTGVNAFLVSGPLRLYSIYGILWLGILTLLLASRKGPLTIYILTLVVAPVLLVLITGDGTRVGVGVSLLLVLALLVVGSAPLVQWFEQRIGAFPLIAVVAVLVVSPTFNIYEFDVIMPWEWVKFQVGDWILYR